MRMSFWNRFVVCLYRGFAGTVPVGRDAAARLITFAHQQGRLPPLSLNDLSLLLILAIGHAGAPLRNAVELEINRRQLVLRPKRLWALLQAIRPPQVADVLEVGRSQPVLRALAGEVLLSSDLLNNLATFLGHLFLRDPGGEYTPAGRFLVQTAGLYYHIPQGTMDFVCRLYRHVLPRVRLDDEALPSAFPPGPWPAWFAGLDVEEQQFLARCLALLPEPDLELLYLHFYGRLTVAQIACVQQQADPSWTADQVARRLEQSWMTVL
jgi:hypothetical protein